jgi:hypothetical protein
MSRNLDDLVRAIEHAEPVHPFKALKAHHFYLDDLVSKEGGLWLMMINALFLVPLLFAAFFYPVPALLVTAVVVGLPLAAYSIVVWRRRPGPPS